MFRRWDFTPAKCPNLKVNQPLVSQSSFPIPPVTHLICNCFPQQTHGQLRSPWKKMKFPPEHFCEPSEVVLQFSMNIWGAAVWPGPGDGSHRPLHQIISKPCPPISIFTIWFLGPVNPVLVGPSDAGLVHLFHGSKEHVICATNTQSPFETRSHLVNNFTGVEETVFPPA